MKASTITKEAYSSHKVSLFRGDNGSLVEVQKLIIELSKLLPEWITVKEFPKGRLVKCVNGSVSS